MDPDLNCPMKQFAKGRGPNVPARCKHYIGGSKGLVHDILKKHGIVVSDVLGIPYCLSCKMAFDVDEDCVKRHLSRSCQLSSENIVTVSSAIRQAFTMLRPNLSMQNEYTRKRSSCPSGVRQNGDALARLPFVEVFQKLKCPMCNFIGNDFKQISKHAREIGHVAANTRLSRDTFVCETVSAQNIWKRKDWQLWFRVKDERKERKIIHANHEVSQGLLNVAKDMESFQTEDMKCQKAVGPQEKSFFLTKTMADEKATLIGLNCKECAELSAGSIASSLTCVLGWEFCKKIQKILEVYIVLARHRIMCLDMNNPDLFWVVAPPGSNEQKYSFHIVSESTERKYSRNACRILFFVLRARKMFSNGSLVTFDFLTNVLIEKLNRFEEGMHSLVHCFPKNISDIFKEVESDERLDIESTSSESEHPELLEFVRIMKWSKNERGKNVLNHLWPSLRALHDVLSHVFYEKQELGKLSSKTHSLADVFCTVVCAKLSKQNTAKWCLGKDVSPTMAALSYVTACIGINAIGFWPSTQTMELEFARIQNLHNPRGRLALNRFAQLLSITKSCRDFENCQPMMEKCSQSGDDHFKCVVVGGVHCSFRRIGMAAREMMKWLWNRYYEKDGFMFGLGLPHNFKRRAQNITDSTSNDEVGFDCRKHEYSSQLKMDCEALVLKAISFLDRCNDPALRCDQILQSVHEASITLQALMHLTGGGPGRGTEIGSMLVSNSQNATRELFFSSGTLYAVPGWSKSQYFKRKIVCRFFDEETSMLFAAFLFIDVYFRKIIYFYKKKKAIEEGCNIPDHEEVQQHFLIGRRKDRQNTMSLISKSWQKFGLTLTGSQYRHWASSYANELAATDPIFKHMIDLGMFDKDSDSGGMDIFGEGEGLQIQAGHSKRTSRLIYGSYVNSKCALQDRMDPNTMKIFRLCSQRWQKEIFAYFHDVPKNAFSDKAQLSSPEKVEKKGREIQCEDVTSKQTLLKALRLGVGNMSALFRSLQQEHAMKIVLLGRKDLLYVDRTGGGKTAVVFGPAILHSGVTVYISPLVSLQSDIKKRCACLRISTQSMQEIRDTGTLLSKGIIILGPEHVDGPGSGYSMVIGTLYNRGVLRRIVIDEVHLTFLHSFRTSFNRSQMVRPKAVNVPMVMMTATLPVKLEKCILQAYHCDELNTEVIRGSLRRSNVGIHVKNLRNSTHIELDQAVVITLQEQFEKNRDFLIGRYLVSVLTRTDADRISSLLSNHFPNATILMHHNGMKEESKEISRSCWSSQLESKWDKYQRLVMIATEGFGTGIDTACVRGVIIAGGVRSLIELWQLSGRIGRRPGSHGELVFLFHPGFLERSGVCRPEPQSKERLREVMQWARRKDECRSLSLETYLGCVEAGKKDPCWLRSPRNGEEVKWCDYCEGHVEISMTGNITANESLFPNNINELGIQTTPNISKECDMHNPTDNAGMQNGYLEPMNHFETIKTPSRIGRKTSMSPPNPEKRINSEPAFDSTFENIHSQNTYSSLTTSEVQKKDTEVSQKRLKQVDYNIIIESFRNKAEIIKKHCPYCLIKTGKQSELTRKLGGVKQHTERQCAKDGCLRCRSKSHDAAQCNVLRKPSRGNNESYCFICYLNTFKGIRIHQGGGSHNRSNEFGNKQLCPFQDVVLAAMCCWRNSQYKTLLISKDIVPKKVIQNDIQGEAFAYWLTKDQPWGLPGINAVCNFIWNEFGFG